MSEELIEKPNTPILVVDLQENGELCEFFTLQDIYDWIDSEAKNWAFLDEGKNRPDFTSINPAQIAGVQNIKNQLSTGRSQLIGQGKNLQIADASVVTGFDAWVKQAYLSKPPKLIHSTSRLGSFILELSRQDPIEAYWVWWIWVRPNEIGGLKPGGLSRRLFTAAMKAVAFESGFDSSSAEIAALEAIHSKWREVLANEHRSFKEQIENVEKLKIDIAGKIAKFHEQMSSSQQQHQALTHDHREEMESIRKKFQDELAVRSSVDYWNTRADEHTSWATFWGKISLSYAAAAFVVLPIIQYSMSGLPNEVKTLIKDGTLDAAGVSTLLTQTMIASTIRFVVMALIAAWPLRIFVRNYLSHSHLEADARERAIVVRTYLALLNDPELAEKEDLKQQILPHALQNIFRHTADGIVKDDGMPWQSVAETIGKKISAP